MECNNEIQVNLSIHKEVFLMPDSASHKLPSHKQNNTIYFQYQDKQQQETAIYQFAQKPLPNMQIYLCCEHTVLQQGELKAVLLLSIKLHSLGKLSMNAQPIFKNRQLELLVFHASALSYRIRIQKDLNLAIICMASLLDKDN